MNEERPEPGVQNHVDLAEDLIEIRDPEIDADEIMAEIRERIKRRRSELGYEKMNFPSYGGVVFPGKPDDIPYDANLYHHLQLANKQYLEYPAEPDLAPSPAARVPILGSLWRLIRQEAHNLVLFYVNRALSHDVEIHRHMISVDNSLTAELQRQQRIIIELKDEVESLRSQIDG